MGAGVGPGRRSRQQTVIDAYTDGRRTVLDAEAYRSVDLSGGAASPGPSRSRFTRRSGRTCSFLAVVSRFVEKAWRRVDSAGVERGSWRSRRPLLILFRCVIPSERQPASHPDHRTARRLRAPSSAHHFRWIPGREEEQGACVRRQLPARQHPGDRVAASARTTTDQLTANFSGSRRTEKPSTRCRHRRSASSVRQHRP